jgi:ubiquinone/menaquinone biosynthesis C-methylase UbiE
MHVHTHTAHDHFVCPPWLAGMLESPLRRAMHNPQKMLAGLVEPGMTVLDIGCGPGYFSLAMARLVGPQGRVIAADLQPAMLARVRAHAKKDGLQERITLQQCEPMRIGWTTPVDFVLAFWMVHEVPDRKALLEEVYSLLKPGGRLLVVEPELHVDRINFAETLKLATAAGFTPLGERKVTISRAMVFGKTGVRDQVSGIR